MIYKELDELIPGSKFILTIRDDESWYKSVNRHIGDLRSPEHEWIYGKGKGLPKTDQANTISIYNNHNKEVINYFKDRPDDLLVIDFTKGDKWGKLCSFLGKDIPNTPFPHYNKGKAKITTAMDLKNKIRLNRKQFKNYFKIKYIELMGYW